MKRIALIAAPAAAPQQSAAPADDVRWPLAIATAADAPACDAKTEGLLVYIKTARSFELCTDGAWFAIDLTGPRGEPGPAGAPGAPGASSVGLPGPKGDKGDPGDIGGKSDPGDPPPPGAPASPPPPAP